MRLRRAGLTGVTLSLDRWDRRLHDRFRGYSGAYECVVRAAEEAQRAGLALCLSLCPTREFVSPDNLDRYAQVARRMGAAFIQIVEPKAVARALRGSRGRPGSCTASTLDETMFKAVLAAQRAAPQPTDNRGPQELFHTLYLRG